MSGSNEAFYREGGKKADAEIHNPILEEGDAPLAFVSTYNVLRGRGVSIAMIEERYGSLFKAAKDRGLI